METGDRGDGARLARLEQELRRKSEEVCVLRSVSTRINATLDLERIYDIVPRLRGLRLPRNPSLYPTFPFAITNPIFVDTDGGGWAPINPPPSWCVPGRDVGCR